ncbi:hypothetical protein Btru_069712 [Bulinus truncatus]|nr:hypothetical protein Btru_069712 [Bulinus truncatus]
MVGTALTTLDIALLLACFISLLAIVAICIAYNNGMFCFKNRKAPDVRFDPYPGPWSDSAVDKRAQQTQNEQ